MIDDQLQLIDKVFTRALELPEEAREDYVVKSCPDDDIRLEVLALLRGATAERLDQRLDTVRERMWSEIVATDSPPEEDLAGQRIGAWRIARRLARGGLATVYVANREDGEFEQTAAFKVLRRGLDTDDVIARFRAERQILSTLDHPAIAQILDGGALPDGRPYLVLEYVDGLAITDYCREKSVSIAGRVGLIIQVLRALNHAHRHTVVHRDIKPSNILVSSEGNVALLDFGIAKLLDPSAMPGSSTLTRTGVSLLTPGYGSPEQHAGEPVTTASDIYQVGVVLYELLTGERPTFRRASGQADDTGPPSRVLRDSPEFKAVKGDLDAITLKAMQADPARRYDSAGEMLADLERYLEGRPVLAQPDTLGYRFSKLTRRRPWLLPAIAIAILAVSTYVVTLTLYSRQLQIEQQRAEAAQQFMINLISSPDPFAPADPERGRNITVVEALDLGRTRIQRELSDEPEVRSALLMSIAGVYSSLDQNERAIDVGEEALALNLELYGEFSEAVISNLRLLGDAYSEIGEYERARRYFERQLDLARNVYGDGDARLGNAETSLGAFELLQGNPDIALPLLRAGIERMFPEPERFAVPLVSAVVTSTQQEGMEDLQESLDLLEEVLPISETILGTDSLYTANVLIAIGRVRVGLRQFERAKAQYAIGLDIYDSQLGPNHADTVTHYNNYGVLLIAAGEYAAAEEVHRELVDRFKVLRGESHRLVADNYQNLASVISRQGRLDEALPLHRKAYEIYQNSGWDHYRTVYPLLSIAYIELENGNAAAAEMAAAEALDTFRNAVPGSFLDGVAMCLVGLAKERLGDAAAGSAMVADSHPLIMQTDLTGTPYPQLCRLPVDSEAESAGDLE